MKRELEINAKDGVARAILITPSAGNAVDKGVILYMDVFGMREALYQMAERIADAGHIVLVPDLYYRMGPYEPFDPKTARKTEATAERLKMLRQSIDLGEIGRDSGSFIEALTVAGAAGHIGTVGYCMGGGHALTAAGLYPDRVKAAASFHGGNLATDAEDSPHRLADRMQARVYVGVAGVDNSFPPEQSARFAESFRLAGVDHAMENYVGMAHGWTVLDGAAYDQSGSERHFKRLLTLLDEAL